MSQILRLLARVASDLQQIGAPWALVGGVAVGVRSRARFTQDLDFAIAAATDRDAERIVAELRRRDYALETLLEQEATDRIATVRLLPHGQAEGALLVDLLFFTCGFEAEVAAEAERLRVSSDLLLPVARTGHLIAMKLLSQDADRRPADIDDLRVLVDSAEESDLALARAAIRLAEQRGTSRGRDLAAELERWLARRNATR